MSTRGQQGAAVRPGRGSCRDGAPAVAPGRTPPPAPSCFHHLFPKLYEHLTNELSFMMKKSFTGCTGTCSLSFLTSKLIASTSPHC